MTSNLVELVNEYYEARKPYTKLLQDAHTDLSSNNPSPDTNTSTAEHASDTQEPQFSISPRIPNEEIMDVLKMLEAAKIECSQGDKSTKKASTGKKGKATAEKK